MRMICARVRVAISVPTRRFAGATVRVFGAAAAWVWVPGDAIDVHDGYR
jgi:hypothetical protein